MRRRLAVATALAALCFTALGSAPAQAAEATVEIQRTFLVARGAAVDVSYGFDCPAGFTGTATASVTQVRDDGLLASGVVVDELTCAGTGVLEMQRVTADITGAPFERGKARVTLTLSACDGHDCFSTTVDQNSRLQN